MFFIVFLRLFLLKTFLEAKLAQVEKGLVDFSGVKVSYILRNWYPETKNNSVVYFKACSQVPPTRQVVLVWVGGNIFVCLCSHFVQKEMGDSL